MGDRQSNHRPLRAGIGITPSGGMPGMGTLGAVARRNSDDALVFVTNTHVVSNGVFVTLSGGIGEYAWIATVKDRFALDDENAYVYQFLPNESDGATDMEAKRVGQLYHRDEEPGTNIITYSWYEAYRKEGVTGSNRPGTTIADIAALRILTGVSADFGVHDPDDPDDDDHDHPKRPIVAPCVAPSRGLSVTCFGANTGKRVVEVSVPTPAGSLVFRTRDLDNYNGVLLQHVFPKENYFIMDQGDAPSARGDSGCPVLCIDDDGNYRLVGIFFGSADGSETGYALPALKAEELLDIRFGVLAPIVVANAPAKALPGQWITLRDNGSGSQEPDGDPLTYQWEWTKRLLASPTVVPTPMGTPSPPFTYPEQSISIYNIAVPLHLGTYTYKLTVTDNNGAKASDIVEVRVQSVVAEAGSNQTVSQGSTVTLYGRGSTASGGGALTHSWEQLGTPGTQELIGVTLSSTSERRPTFTAPSFECQLLFRLTVLNSNGVEDTSDVKITVSPSTSSTPVPAPTQSRPRPTTPPATPAPGPEPEPPTPGPGPWGEWTDTGRIVITSYSNWRDTGRTLGALENRRKEQIRNINREKIQQRTRSNGDTETRAVPLPTTTESKWVPDPEPEVWGEWADTGRTRENQVLLIMEKQQRRTSNYSNTQTQWVLV